jgi:shikimate dehydrogenase
VLHRAAYAALRLDWDYVAIDCGEHDLADVLARRTDWAGFSCTMPLKRAALEIAAEVDPLAAAVGAANTLLPRPSGDWAAHNTDVHGVVASLGDGAAGGAATVLGAGGTAQAVIVALARLGIGECTVAVRDLSRVRDVRATADRVGLAVEFDLLSADAYVVSTLPRNAADQVAGFRWRAAQTVLDVVYDPWPTALGQHAAARGATVHSGAQMLLHQAAAQVELMTGQPAPVEVMRAALQAAQPGAGV